MQQAGMEVQALQDRPILNRWVIEYWEAFQILSSSRTAHQGGIGPIPLSEITSYLEAVYIRDVDDRLTYIRMIQSLDNVYVKHINEKAKQGSRAHKSKPVKRR
jgi:hypothetical protein